jgi:hypothetical protein
LRSKLLTGTTWMKTVTNAIITVTDAAITFYYLQC